jgi:Tol biopolymer transport system component
MRRLLPITLTLFCLTTLILVGMLAFLRQKPSTAEWVAYMQQGSGGRTDLYLMSPDGKNKRQIVIDVHNGFAPRLSPDGSMLLFLYHRYDNPEFCIYSFKNNQRHCFAETEHLWGRSQWLPSGQSLVFFHNRGMYQIDLKALQPELIVEYEFLSESVVPTPDGKGLIYQIGTRTGDELHRVDLNGRSSELFFKSKDAFIHDFVWSPNGKWLVISYSVPGRFDIPLLVDKNGNSIFEFPQGLEWQLWTADNQLVFRDDSSLYLANPESFEVKSILNFEYQEGKIILSPDGKSLLLVLMNSMSESDIYRLDLNNFHLEALGLSPGYVVPVASTRFDLAWHAEWLGIGSGVLLLMTIGMQGIFSNNLPFRRK